MKKIGMILGTVSIAMSAIFVRMASAPSIVLVFYRMHFDFIAGAFDKFSR